MKVHFIIHQTYTTMKLIDRLKALPILIFLFIGTTIYAQHRRVIEYDLVVHDTIVDYSGKKRKAIAINGQIPGPTLHFTEGDSAVIRVHNRTKGETTMHWHGLVLPVEQDGVPYLTTAPTFPGETHTYTYPIVQNGTYFYHSHSGTQQQSGVYGAFIIDKKKNDPRLRPEDKLPTEVVMLSDWTDTNPHEVMRWLKTASDWAGIKKKSTQSYWEALRAGYLGTKFKNEWKRMSAMDVSDVYYNKFLVNGKADDWLNQYKAGDKIRLKVINGASSTNFWLRYSGGKIKVLASDGQDVVPVDVDRVFITVAETYDIELEIPEANKAYELSATAEDRTGYSQLWLGVGDRVGLPPMGQLNLFEGMKSMNAMMDMRGNMELMDMGLQQMDMNEVMYPASERSANENHAGGTSHGEEMSSEMSGHSGHSSHGGHTSNSSEVPVTLNYNMLMSPYKTTLPEDKEWKELVFDLTGNMERYVWSMNNKTLSEQDKIEIKDGENVRIILRNKSMMRHPMHLHGHFFRLVNQHGEYSPLKTVVDIMPMETDTIEFNASERNGDWFFHCHILYHMMSGMGVIFEYENSLPNPQLPNKAKDLKKVYAEDRKFYLTAKNEFLFNGNVGKFQYESTRWAIQGDWQLGYESKHGWETNIRFGRYMDKMQWFLPYVGLEWSYKKGLSERSLFGQWQTNRRIYAVAGVRYTLPWFIVVDGRFNMYGKARVQLEREDIPLTSRLRMDMMANTDKEYRVALSYIITPYIGITGSWSNEMKWGAGVKISY